MNKETTWIVVGLAALGIVLYFVSQSSSTSTSYGVDTGTAQTVGAIVGANANAINAQSAEQTSIANTSAGLIQGLSNNATSEAIAAGNNATTVTVGANNNTTAVSLANITAATQQHADTLGYQATAGKTAADVTNTAVLANSATTIATTQSNNALSAQQNTNKASFWGGLWKDITNIFSPVSLQSLIPAAAPAAANATAANGSLAGGSGGALNAAPSLVA